MRYQNEQQKRRAERRQAKQNREHGSDLAVGIVKGIIQGGKESNQRQPKPLTPPAHKLKSAEHKAAIDAVPATKARAIAAKEHASDDKLPTPALQGQRPDTSQPRPKA